MNIKLILASAAALLAGCASSPQLHATEGLARIEHIVVIYAENRSFDHLYGFFPGADGIASATPEQKAQLDHDGNPLPHLPPVYDGGKPSPEFPQGLPNGPFRIDAPPVNRRMDEVLPSPIHGYFDGSKMKLWKWAQEYTLADHFFMAAFGGSYLNHQWLVCACTPMDTGAPASVKPQLDEKGNLKKKPISPASVMQGPVEVFDGRVTPDGYTVNTSQPPYQPSGIPPAAGASLDLADTAHHPVPPLKEKTIGDTLSAKSVSWVWYAGGWNEALADGRQDPKAKRNVIYNRDKGSPIYQPHHQPRSEEHTSEL